MFTVTSKTDTSFEGEFHDDAKSRDCQTRPAAPGVALDEGDTLVIPRLWVLV
jgi:hypothetical protein